MWCPVVPMFTDPRSSWMSFRRTDVPLMAYELPPSEDTSRTSVTSSNERSAPAPLDAENEKRRSELSNVMDTFPFCMAPRSFEPFQIMSPPPLPRMDLMDCSPSTKRMDSTTLDLPEPFGPTMAVTGVSKDSVVFFAKDLNPEISSFLSIYAS